MDTYRIVMLGPKGAGKTLYLASLWNRLSLQRLDLGFFLNAVDPENGKDNAATKARLNRIFAQVAWGDEFPAGNDFAVSEYCFECRVVSHSQGRVFPVCRFVYMDYAGGRLNDPDVHDSNFEEKIAGAHVLMGLLDGEKILAAMSKQGSADAWLGVDLRGVLERMQGRCVPIHFVLSKWDILKQHFGLEEVRKFLLDLEDFRSLLDFGGTTRIRLIPVSALGFDFVTLKDGAMHRILGGQVKPFQVEMPLACILPDIIASFMRKIAEKEESFAKEFARGGREPVGLGGLLRAGGAFMARLVDGVAALLDINPMAVEIVTRWMAKPHKDWQLQREEAIKAQLAAVIDQKSAYTHAYQVFARLTLDLERAYPSSFLTSVGRGGIAS